MHMMCLKIPARIVCDMPCHLVDSETLSMPSMCCTMAAHTSQSKHTCCHLMCVHHALPMLMRARNDSTQNATYVGGPLVVNRWSMYEPASSMLHVLVICSPNLPKVIPRDTPCTTSPSSPSGGAEHDRTQAICPNLMSKCICMYIDRLSMQGAAHQL